MISNDTPKRCEYVSGFGISARTSARQIYSGGSVHSDGLKIGTFIENCKLKIENCFALFPLAKRGFTLIESLVALSILALAIVGPLSLASTALSAAQISRDQLVAFYLAQEGLEVIRNQRDTNRLNGAIWTNSWMLCSGLAPCAVLVDGSKDNVLERIRTCSPPTLAQCLNQSSSALHYLTGEKLYTHSQGDPTDFKRAIELEKIGNEDTEYKLTSKVTWVMKGGRERNVILIEYIRDLD